MIRHVLFTGEIGAGKSTTLRETIWLLGVNARGVETWSPQPRGVLPKELYLREYASEERGTLVCVLPDGSKSGVTAVFDTQAVKLLHRAQAQADVIVLDEIGRLEKDAAIYHRALEACLDGGKPVVGVIRRHKAEWADWIRKREDVLLLEVTQDNRGALPGEAAKQLRRILNHS